MLRTILHRSVWKPIQQHILRQIYRQIVGNACLHTFILKHYRYLDGMAAEKLRKVAGLLHDAALKSKVESHLRDEEQHATLFGQRIVELGGSPAFTPAELEVCFLRGFDSHDFGLSAARLGQDHDLDRREIITFFALLKAEAEKGLQYFMAHLQVLDHDPETRRMLEEVIADEHRHVAYLSEELERLGYSGFQPYSDGVSSPDRKRPARECAKHGAHRPTPQTAAPTKSLHADERDTARVRQAGAAAQEALPALRGIRRQPRHDPSLQPDAPREADRWDRPELVCEHRPRLCTLDAG